MTIEVDRSREIRYGGRTLAFHITLALEPLQMLIEEMYIAAAIRGPKHHMTLGRTRRATGLELAPVVAACIAEKSPIPLAGTWGEWFVNCDETLEVVVERLKSMFNERGLTFAIAASVLEGEEGAGVWTDLLAPPASEAH